MRTCSIVSLIMVWFVSGCGKEVGEKNLPLESLTFHSWTMISYHTDPSLLVDSTEVSELLEVMPECEQDDRLTFLKNGAYSWAEGTLECSRGSIPTQFFHPDSMARTQIVSPARRGSWRLENDQSVLVFIDPNSGVERRVEVMELSPALLKFRYRMRKNGRVHTVTKMFNHH